MAVDREKLQEESPVLRFYRIILGWDYFRLLKESLKNKGKVGDGASSGLREVKDTYKDVDDYISTFEPLIFEEVKAQITQKRDEEEVTQWHSRLVVECNEVDGFHLPAVTYAADDTEESISQNDLLLLSKENFQGGTRMPTTYAFALVENCQSNSFRLRMYLAGEAEHSNTDVVKSCQRLLSMQNLITSPTSEVDKLFYSLKICSLSTIAREYVALWSIGSLPFKDLILSAAEKNIGCENQGWKISKSLEEYVKLNHNETQQEAIQAGLARKAFVLIQGPPGTGKTKTIIGLLSAILHASPARVLSKGELLEIKHRTELPMQEKYNHWARASPWLTSSNPRDNIMPIDGDNGFFPTTGNELCIMQKPEVVNSSRKYRVRVLVCAPSNSALDEIVLRVLNTGVRDENDRAYNPKIVRIGLKEHHSVRAVSMDYLVKQKQESMNAGKDKHGAPGRDKDSIRAAILDEAVIVFSTLSFSGSTLFSKWNRGFDVVIIDEAAQAVEPATLIPLANGCKQVFLVGDPVQLPATVISPAAEKFGYGTSLFKRFQRAGYPVTMLKTQYRMHPEIRRFPSKEFYAESLEDGPNIEVHTSRSWHEYQCFGPFCFFDLHEGRESKLAGSESWVNVDEVEFVLLMYHKLVSMYPGLKSSSQLAIISPYSQQVKLLRDRFKSTFGVDSNKVVDITTVDGCQGREKDVAIFSCVRASKDKSIGFLADFRRMNVGITRAKSSVLVVGSSSTLRRDEHWNNLVESAEKRNCFFKVSKPYTSFFTDENLDSMKVKNVEPLDGEAGQPDEDAFFHVNHGDADQGLADEHDYGDGDGDMDVGGMDDD
ncbi:probable helicase MAGATAMA 3 isoform X1 [Corylus avellana]|uniref:probable helicase MAGATAMA 3 isoform X1 n=1 Tax=Corylus avellana TaxID=13451 RepID=UPI00286B7CC6|nr:probable helicase MAGATAMA 3 isoform X1 [Corylus avellana]XP_059433883.1 probable helicase MAGATAMA 3 isoform X1 [Corylus avellana]XP_059433885.1 probable helicase MAGATAMA 3 isoform X1 [Corylus avellana]